VRIDNLVRENRENRCRVAADITWEDSDVPAGTLFFETSDSISADVRLAPDAFLVAALPAAMWTGEKRIRIEGEVCTRLRDSLPGAMALFEAWYDRCGPLEMEPMGGYRATKGRSTSRTAAFLTGGVDSLALLRANSLDYGPDHRGSIRECLFLHGLNIFDFDESDLATRRLATFEQHLDLLRPLAESVGATMLPVYTNARAIYPSYESFQRAGGAAATVAAAHVLIDRMTDVWLASEATGPEPYPVAYHPQLVNQYSSASLEVHLGLPAASRLENTQLVAEWDVALATLLVCPMPDLDAYEGLNCGRCEKCVRTMLALLVLGKLAEAHTFPFNDVTPDMLEPISFNRVKALSYYAECVGPLEAMGRDDLSASLRNMLEPFREQPAQGRIGRLAGLLGRRRNRS
jgi:hypothetical protein